MKPLHTLVSLSLLVALGGNANAITLVPLDPRATYLHTNNDSPTPPGALALSLADYGFAAGDRIQLQSVGNFDNGPDGETFYRGIAVFSSSNTLLANSQAHRVPGAIASDGANFISSPTWFGGQPTDIPEDFQFVRDPVTVTVPAGAAYLFVAAYDRLYYDNTDPNHDFGVLIGAAPVPEPAVALLMVSGLLVLARRSRAVG